MSKNNIFSKVQLKPPPRSVFDLSHDVKMSLNMGILYPTLTMEVVPGDSFQISCESLLRFAPMLAPVMHRIDVYMHYFFVPNRLVWPNWEKYVTGQPIDEPPPAFPTLDVRGVDGDKAKNLSYYGLPSDLNTSLSGNQHINAIPFAAYNKIYNEYYRDQNLIDPILDELVDGENDTAQGVTQEFFQLRRRAWEHDYFTSALPWAQKGNSVDIPLGQVGLNPDSSSISKFVKALDHADANIEDIEQSGVAPNGSVTIGGVAHVYDPMGTLQVEPTTINDLRRAFRLQEWFEKQARGGTRYIEVILAHFGIKSSDARLQRPEYITGSKSPVTISEVLNSTGLEGELPQGNMAGHAVSVTTGNYGKYFAEEHGYIIGIMSVMPKTAYQNGIPKHFLKINDTYEFYWPEFANIGEQAIVNQEVHWEHAEPNGTFGYIPRYAEYKFINSRTAGDFTDSLSYWTMTRELTETVALNKEFIECTPTQDIFAVTDANVDKLYAHVYHKIRAIRPMPFYGNPSF